jgi:Mg-chelatase subunit ChlD
LNSEIERLQRWRLVLGGGESDGIGASLDAGQIAVDGVLAALYDAGSDDSRSSRGGGLGASSSSVARWLGDIREYFPASVVSVMQNDAMKRLNLKRMLLEPEVLETVQPDVNLVATLIALSGAIPERTRATARVVVRKVVDDLERKLAQELRQAITGALNRAVKNNRPRRLADVDWNSTIRRNLRHYQPEYGTIIAERLVGHGRRRSAPLRDVILAVDQSGSMASSVVHSSILAAVLASVRAVTTQMVVFDTTVVDLTDKLADPVDVLFGTNLGGGTDINQALGYAQTLVRRPADTIMLLISDLYEGGSNADMLQRAAAIVASSVNLIVLLSLSDSGTAAYDRGNAEALAANGLPGLRLYARALRLPHGCRHRTP